MAEQIIEGVNPTRMELLEIRKKRTLAEKGHKLLEEKRDALVDRFFDIIDKRNALKKILDQAFSTAYRSLTQAQMILGDQQVDLFSQETKPLGDIAFSSDNIMGVKIPIMDLEHVQSQADPAYGFLNSTAKLDDAYLQFREIGRQLLELADIESSIKSLTIEIEKTKRRVNVLENTLIPKLLATIKYIEMQLEEREREDFFRRKRIKALMEAKKQ
ncbi:MAG: V-type ATP synthase subunit D [Candidatus Thermoplasmatota archaeon]|nr:V-type ATP synthase subunit D [Candidatus Thermoplasmatota archaeon]